jgi:hypothetical protein
MSNLNVDTVFIVGAGFSYHAGLPVASRFTEAILEAREYKHGPSRIIVDFLSKFIHDAFDHSTRAGAKYWPELEDVFTCVDLSANSGHHLGGTFAPADLRTVRRTVLSRIIRMLDQKYQNARRQKGPDWKKLDDFFVRIDSCSAGFISMNWDTVIERKLQANSLGVSIDYGCDALRAGIPDPPNEDEYPLARSALKKLTKEGQKIVVVRPTNGEQVEKKIPVVKIHGSSNWLYCDNCRQLYWFHPDQSKRIADQLITEDDLHRISLFLQKKGKHVEKTIEDLLQRPKVHCLCSNGASLGKL